MKRALLVALVVLLVPAPGVYRIPSCIEEDGSGQAVCLWDARTRGNGEGTSFLKIGHRYITLP